MLKFIFQQTIFKLKTYLSLDIKSLAIESSANLPFHNLKANVVFSSNCAILSEQQSCLQTLFTEDRKWYPWTLNSEQDTTCIVCVADGESMLQRGRLTALK